MMKLVLFGDSLINNFNKPICQEIEKGADVDVYNCAVGGWDTNDGVAKAPYITELHPNIVLYSFGTNDAAPWKQVDIETYKSNLEVIFKTFKDAEKIFFLPPPVNEEKQPENLKRLNSVIKDYYQVARDLCLSNSVKVIDSWMVFKPMLDSGQDYHDEDGVHFNDLGYQVLIGEIVKVLNESN